MKNQNQLLISITQISFWTKFNLILTNTYKLADKRKKSTLGGFTILALRLEKIPLLQTVVASQSPIHLLLATKWALFSMQPRTDNHSSYQLFLISPQWNPSAVCLIHYTEPDK
jgi:hypothetical protein